ncbi:MAG: ATP-binding protein [Nitriliruptoraceae bacterium]
MQLVVGMVVVAATALVTALTLPAVTAVVVTVVVTSAVTVALLVIDHRRLSGLAVRVGGWVGAGEHEAVELSGSEAWRQFGTALNVLGAAYHRRGARLDRERPWRRELVDALVGAALLFDRDSRMLAANEEARALLGIPAGAEDLTVLQAVGSPAIAQAVREARDTGSPVGVDVEHASRDLRAVASLVGNETLLLIADRTHERRVEDLRRNFVVNASHELKTPVTSIQTLAEALAVTVRDDPERTVTLVARLGVEAERMARLLHDLLDLRRLEERGTLDRRPVDLVRLAQLAIADVVPRADDREVTVGLSSPDEAIVAGVPGDLEVIVKNLVENALQYNRPGGTIDVTIEPRDGSQVVTVADTGIGIPQPEQSRIFERFYRVDTARSRETGGTGLGLSIVRHAVERHGGTISVASLLGEGTTFTVVLPVETPR